MGPRLLTLDETTLRRRTSIKWRQYAPDVLPLWIAEMDVMPSPAVVEELSRIARDGDTGYPVNAAYMEAVAAFYTEYGAAVASSTLASVWSLNTGAITAMPAPINGAIEASFASRRPMVPNTQGKEIRNTPTAARPVGPHARVSAATTVPHAAGTRRSVSITWAGSVAARSTSRRTTCGGPAPTTRQPWTSRRPRCRCPTPSS